MILRLYQPATRSAARYRILARWQLPVLSAPRAPDNSSAPPRLQTRCYLGGAGEMKSRRDIARAGDDDAVARREQELWDRARPRYDTIMERHVRLPTMGDGVDDATDDADQSREERELDVRKKRLIYRSKQRGWLEVDLLLGTWASENVSDLSLDDLNEYEKFVNLETIDIYNVLTLRTDVPEEMKGVGEKSLVEKIQEWVKGSPLGRASMERYAEVKMKNNLT